MKKFNLLIILLLLFFYACDSKKGKTMQATSANEGILVSGENANASSPYFTKDPLGNPVLCWTEQQNKEEGFVLKFATFQQAQGRFGKPKAVTPSMGTREHAESMNKVAFKSDGTVVAVYAKKLATKAHPYAGFLWYTMSTDNGKNWSPPHYLHSDTLPTYGRSFFDLATLSNGEVGAIWLDGRFKQAGQGSALFFAKTTQNKGFGMDKQIGKSTCQCCRTDIFVDGSGDIHVAYRDIIDGDIRDMVHQVSLDNGKTFSAPHRISVDNWEINACPHTGPSLAGNKAGLQAVWFTAGGGPGVYFATSVNNGRTFSLREKVSMAARHPQLVFLTERKTALVWDEPLHPNESNSNIHEAHTQHGHSGALAGSKVILQIRDPNAAIAARIITPEGTSAAYPVLATLGKEKLLIAWTQKKEDRTEVYYKLIDWE